MSDTELRETLAALIEAGTNMLVAIQKLRDDLHNHTHDANGKAVRRRDRPAS